MDFDKSFIGTGWSFPPEFSRKSGRVKMVSAEDDIKESLHILFSTSPGERVMQPTYGCGLKTMMFEIISESIVTEIKDVVERAILFFEPRITLNSITINSERAIEGVLEIFLNYTVRTTNSRNNMVYPFYFQEGTNISP
ncbi:MAG: GPW/gp25 family protein [Desulfosarcina sp.]|nr:GPW/gp25 family protein [Desulfobacterales bacterium]